MASVLVNSGAFMRSITVMCYRRREKVVKALQSNPFQFTLCVIILLDAVIVIAQILIDINSIKGNSITLIHFR